MPERADLSIKPTSRQSLQGFLAVVVFLSIAIPAVLSGGFLIWQNYERSVEQESQAAAEGYADLLEAGMAIPLWNVSPDLGQPLIESIFVDSAVLSVIVTTEQGKPFLEYVRSQAEIDSQQTISQQRTVTYSGERLGDVSLVYSLERALARSTHEARLLAVIIFAQLVVSLVTLSWVLHKRVLSPVKKLGVAASGIAKGDLKTAIPRLKNDEFGDLSQQLEMMRGVLEANFTELEQRVDERTTELKSVNTALRGTLDQLRMAQDNLIQQEKLAALGALVAGVAHELNTPIGNGLTVSTSLCESCVTIKKDMREGLTRSALEKFIRDMDEGTQLVNRNLEKASELVSSFKQVAVDRTSVQRRRFSLLSFLSETRLTVSPIFKRTPYEVVIDAPDDIQIESYPGPLGQVITNLLNNAVVHAFAGRDHGKVTLRARAVADEVELAVEDDGCGIPPEHHARIYDPFFTTKLGEGGNGLGMHIVHNIVTGMLGGSIKLSSTVGMGTCFTLRLPLVAPADDPEWKSDDQEAFGEV